MSELSIRSKILFTNIVNIEEVFDLLDEVQNSTTGVVDILHDNIAFLETIQSSLQESLFLVGDEQAQEEVTTSSIYLNNLIRMINERLSGMTPQTDDQKTLDKYAYRLGISGAITDEILKSYTVKSIATYAVFLSTLSDILTPEELKGIADQEHIELYSAFVDVLKEREDFITPYLNYDFEKAENIEYKSSVDELGYGKELSEEERKELEEHVIAATGWSNFVAE